MTYWVCACRNTNRLKAALLDWQDRCGYCGKTRAQVIQITGKRLELIVEDEDEDDGT